MFLPDWIYRMLPVAYLIGGLVISYRMDSFIGVASGVLLGSAGLLVWKMRSDYRREMAGINRRQEGPPSLHGLHEWPEGNLGQGRTLSQHCD